MSRNRYVAGSKRRGEKFLILNAAAWVDTVKEKLNSMTVNKQRKLMFFSSICAACTSAPKLRDKLNLVHGKTVLTGENNMNSQSRSSEMRNSGRSLPLKQRQEKKENGRYSCNSAENIKPKQPKSLGEAAAEPKRGAVVARGTSRSRRDQVTANHLPCTTGHSPRSHFAPNCDG